MGKPKWTREEIIRRILDLDAKGYPMTVGKPGVSPALYQAGSRIFGSWRNALLAAGLSPDRGNCDERWPPAKILMVIRNLSRRRKPLRKRELEERFGNLVSAARRIFGSWSKAILASGVDPAKLRRVAPWTRERVLETLLTRALRNQPVSARLMEPRSIVEAGRRFFGSWSATLEAAGLDPAVYTVRPRSTRARAGTPSVTGTRRAPPPRLSWTPENVVAAIRARHLQQKPLYAVAVQREETPLYCAARRLFKNWRSALLAAGFCPEKHRLIPRRPPKPSVGGLMPPTESRKPEAPCDPIDPLPPALS
ncbi:hypothetical protein J0H58_12265 [bacterium]|nr:hypothetical protein [bacterium]